MEGPVRGGDTGGYEGGKKTCAQNLEKLCFFYTILVLALFFIAVNKLP